MEKTLTRVALDAMGGDNAPAAIVQGAIDALNQGADVQIILVGVRSAIEAELAKYTYDKSRVEIVEASEIIETTDHPVEAIRHKKDSSMVVGLKLVKDGQADGFISSGSSGALLVGGQLIAGRIKGIDRPPFAPLIPTEKGVSLLLDCGANVDARANHLVQFARLGSLYYKTVLGKENPTVAIVNIGEEEEKGNALVKETFPLLKECEDINFIGSIESRQIPQGYADVIVCEAFAGNIILKLYEGLGKTLMGIVKGSLMKNLCTKIGALLVKKSIKESFKTFDSSEYGGAPMLGLKGLVMKTHGSAKAKEIKNAVFEMDTCKKQGFVEKMKEAFDNAAQ